MADLLLPKEERMCDVGVAGIDITTERISAGESPPCIHAVSVPTMLHRNVPAQQTPIARADVFGLVACIKVHQLVSNYREHRLLAQASSSRSPHTSQGGTS